MNRNTNRKLQGLVLVLTMWYTSLFAQPVSPFNNASIKDTSAVYSFVVSGHFHGASTNASTFPASSLLANIDTLNAMRPLFLMSLGDIFLDVNETYLTNYNRHLFSKLKMPFFNAVGNHDLSNGNKYETIYGKTFYSFTIQSECFIVLNTEMNDGNIEGEQLELLKDALTKARKPEVKNVFVFSHRPVWAENDETFAGLFAGNTRSTFGKNNFESVVRPMINEFSKSKPLYWMSGSMAGGPSSFFYHKVPGLQLTFMQTAIRDLPRDAVLKVLVDKGHVTFAGVSLTGQNLNTIESYDIAYWKGNSAPEEKFNFRLIPYLTLQLLSSIAFWLGFVSAILILFALRFILKRWKKRK